jgi:hypothetical protein
VTVAIAVKVFDGIVLAADSATTLPLVDANGTVVSHQVYNSANKVFQLHRKKPVGAMTWGLGQIGSASIATLAKDLRRRLTGQDPDHEDWELGPNYTIEEVAQRVAEMMHGELYSQAFAAATGPFPVLGFLVAGYSGHEKNAEAWVVEISDPANTPAPTCTAAQDDSGWWAYGQPDAVARLLNGHDIQLEPAVRALVPAADHPALDAALGAAARQLVVAPMPFADAINLARFLVDTTVGYVRFTLGPDTVGGPVEVASLSRHEGFKWIERKHYYSSTLNPEDPHHDL